VAASGPTGVGASLVASPTGEELVSAGPDPQLLLADIDPEIAQKARDSIAVLHNRSGSAQFGKAESLG
jgi:predicted amidohydrolase